MDLRDSHLHIHGAHGHSIHARARIHDDHKSHERQHQPLPRLLSCNSEDGQSDHEPHGQPQGNKDDRPLLSLQLP